MNIVDLAERIAANSPNLTKAQARKVLNAAFAAISEAASKGEDVILMGFGKFVVRDRDARTGANPKTGEPIQIAAAKTLVFHPSKAVKDILAK
jgi:DNA-binding protein HU-beta